MIQPENMTPRELGMLRASEHEIRRAIKLLETHGYLVRKPSEAKLPVVIEVVPTPSQYHIGIRADVSLNGATGCFGTTHPVELMLDYDDATYRDEHVPRHLANELADYLAQAMLPAIVDQVKAKIEPLVPEKPMSLADILGHIAFALHEGRKRSEPPERRPPFPVMEGHRR